LQPLARLWGRTSAGLTPWRAPGGRLAIPRPRTETIWSEDWESPRDRLARLWADLRLEGAAVLSGGSFDRWDIQVRAGPLGLARIRLGVAGHGDGRRLLKGGVLARAAKDGAALAAVLASLA